MQFWLAWLLNKERQAKGKDLELWIHEGGTVSGVDRMRHRPRD